MISLIGNLAKSSQSKLHGYKAFTKLKHHQTEKFILNEMLQSSDLQILIENKERTFCALSVGGKLQAS